MLSVWDLNVFVDAAGQEFIIERCVIDDVCLNKDWTDCWRVSLQHGTFQNRMEWTTGSVLETRKNGDDEDLKKYFVDLGAS